MSIQELSETVLRYVVIVLAIFVFIGTCLVHPVHEYRDNKHEEEPSGYNHRVAMLAGEVLSARVLSGMIVSIY